MIRRRRNSGRGARDKRDDGDSDRQSNERAAMLAIPFKPLYIIARIYTRIVVPL